jgi:hypothetical protein
MLEAQNAGMERLPAQILQGQSGGRRQTSGARQEAFAIKLVAQKRVADVAQVNPDLVGAARFQAALEKRGLAWLIKAP